MQDTRVINGFMQKSYKQSQGFALFTTMVIVIIVGIVAVSGLRQTELTEVLAGNSIQRSRALQAAEGGLIQGENETAEKTAERVFSSNTAEDGIFSKDAAASQWWRDDTFSGATEVTDTTYPGVVEPPSYIVEEVGSYVSDGGSGIVSLDRGGGGYGRRTASGRELILYKLQSSGVGSTTDAKAIVESLYVRSQ